MNKETAQLLVDMYDNYPHRQKYRKIFKSIHDLSCGVYDHGETDREPEWICDEGSVLHSLYKRLDELGLITTATHKSNDFCFPPYLTVEWIDDEFLEWIAFNEVL